MVGGGWPRVSLLPLQTILCPSRVLPGLGVVPDRSEQPCSTISYCRAVAAAFPSTLGRPSRAEVRTSPVSASK